MTKKKVTLQILMLAVVLILIAGFLIVQRNHKKTLQDLEQDVPDVSTEKMDEAMEQLASSGEPAEVIRGVNTTERLIAVTLDGMTDADTMKQILDVLQQYNIQATFFAEGVLAAEDGDTLKAVREAGYEVGSYTLSGQKHMEEKEEEELVRNFMKTSQVLEEILGEAPQLLKCNVTEYTDKVLRCARAAELESVVESDAMLSARSFASEDQAEGFLKSAAYGSIVSIKLNEELDEEEYEPLVQEETPAEDLQANLELTGQDTEEKTEEPDIVETVEYFAEAVSMMGFQTVFVKDLPEYDGVVADYQSMEEELDGRLAKVYSSIPNEKNWIGLAFRGISNEKHLDEVLEVLKAHQAKATFYATAAELRKYPDITEKIRRDGHAVENGGGTGMTAEGLEFSQIYDEISQGMDQIKESLGQNSQFYMPRYGKYDVNTQKAAASLETFLITYSKNPVVDKEKTVDEIMEYFAKGLKNGDIIYLDLDYYEEIAQVTERVLTLAEEENHTSQTAAEMMRCARDQEQTASGGRGSTDTAGSRTASASQGQNGSVQNPQAAVQAAAPAGGTAKKEDTQSKEDKIKKKIKTLKKQNDGKLAQEQKEIRIVKDAVVFEFYGISNKNVLNSVLSALKSMGAKATFYVDETDAKLYPKRIQKILDAGCEIGIAMKPAQGDTSETIACSLYQLREKMKKSYDVDVNLVFQPWGAVNSEAKEAVSLLGLTLAGYDTGVVRGDQQKEKDPKKVIAKLFNSEMYAAVQGQIFYFRMDFYENDELLAKVMKELKKQKLDNIVYKPESKGLTTKLEAYDGFDIVGLWELLYAEGSYEYPLPESSILGSVKNAVHSGQMKGKDLYAEVLKRYIGTPSAHSTAELPGFTEEEVAGIDYEGRIRTDKKEIFLSFDDWGSDAALNKLLYVLKKHNVKATFFIRTANVKDNPNLLRKVAYAGHHLASHTDTHMTLANREDENSPFTELSENQLKALQKDLLASYRELQKTAGDIAVDGVPAVTRWFRPPTLAVGRNAMETVFDCGFTYIISGNISAHDYEAETLDELYKNLTDGLWDETGNVRSGSVFVMHMSDNSRYTAEAVDRLLTENEKKSSDDPGKFVVGNLSDYLNTDSYQQISSEIGVHKLYNEEEACDHMLEKTESILEKEKGEGIHELVIEKNAAAER